MSDKKPKHAEINATTSTYLMGTVDLPAGKYTKARLLDIILGFDTVIEAPVAAKFAAAAEKIAENGTIVVMTTTTPIPVITPNAADNANLLAWNWTKTLIPVGIPSITLVFAALAWLRADKERLDKAVAALHTDGKQPKLKKTLSDFADVVGRMPVSDSARWLFTVLHTGDVTSVKAVHEALAQINGEQLVADLWKWGLSYTAVIHSTDAALAAAANDEILNICRGEREDKSGSDDNPSADVHAVVDRINKAASSAADMLMTTTIKGRSLAPTPGELYGVPEPAKQPDAVIEPLNYGPPGDDLVQPIPGGALHRETDVQKNVSPASEYDLVEEKDQETDVEPRKKLAGSASAVIKALRDGFNKLGPMKTVQLADKMSQMTEPAKAVSAVVKLMTMVDEAENGALLAKMVDEGYVSVAEIESVFRDNWMGLYTSLCGGLRTIGPRPPWINDGLLAQKTA